MALPDGLIDSANRKPFTTPKAVLSAWRKARGLYDRPSARFLRSAYEGNPYVKTAASIRDYVGWIPGVSGNPTMAGDLAEGASFIGRRMVQDPFGIRSLGEGLDSIDRMISGDAPPEQHTPTTAPPKTAIAKTAATAHTPTAIAAKNGVKSSLFSSEEGGVEPVETPKIPDMGGAGVLMAPDDPRRAPVPQESGSPLRITRDPDGTVRWTGGGSQGPGSFKRTGDPRVIHDAFGGTAVEGDRPGFAMANETETRRLGELARAAQTQEARNALGIQQAQAADLQRYGFIPDEKTRNTIVEWEKTAQDDADYKAALDEINALKGTAPGYDDKWYDEAVRSVQFDHFLKNKAPGGAYMANKKALSPLDAIAGVTNGPG